MVHGGNFGTLEEFFAGIFGTLAFGWLVLGYYFQRKELELQREQIKGVRQANEELVRVEMMRCKRRVNAHPTQRYHCDLALSF